jgi:hypothetical protein
MHRRHLDAELKKKKIKEGLALSAESNEMALILSE